MKTKLHLFKAVFAIVPFITLSFNIKAQMPLADYLNQPTVTVQELSNCNFEQVCPEVDTATSAGWQIGIPSKTLFDSAYSVTNAIVTDTLNDYPLNSNMHFDLQVQNNIPHANLIEFWHKLDSDSLLDGGYIEVSKDTGVTWVNLLEEFEDNPHLLITENFYSSSDTLYNGEKGFSGSISEWKKVRVLIDWSYPVKAFWPAGDFQIRFKFISDNVETNKEGWVIDNLTISEVINSVGVVEQNRINPLIYPNPTTDQFTIQFNQQEPKEELIIVVYNTLGQEVANQKVIALNHIISLKENPKGIYKLIVKNSNTIVYNSTVVKN
jgi:hypothetical protein